MDPTILTKILAAGAMGASIFCIFKVYGLLKNEQEREQPRPVFIKTIYVSMIFAVVMTLLSLGIEKVRHNMEQDKAADPDLSKTLNALAGQNFYSFNKDGNPKQMVIPYNDSNYVLGKAFPHDYFKRHPLVLKPEEDDFVVQRENKGQVMSVGTVSALQLREAAKTITAGGEEQDNSLSAEAVLNLGLAYAPNAPARALNLSHKEDESLANDYLIQLLDSSYADAPAAQKSAIQLLTQPELMRSLKQNQYKKLIEVLEQGSIRQAPYNIYELSQVYYSRAYQSWNTAGREADLKENRRLLNEYIRFYDATPWIQERSRYKSEYNWYKTAKRNIG